MRWGADVNSAKSCARQQQCAAAKGSPSTALLRFAGGRSMPDIRLISRVSIDLMTSAQRQHRFAVILAFALVYFFWGSTYLGIDIAVEQIPPALMCGIRFLIAGVFMLAFCALRGRRISYSPQQLGRMAIVGVLLLMGGNLTLSYAEKHVASGLAALIIAVTPLWFLVLDSLLLGDHHIAVRGKIGLAWDGRPGGVAMADLKSATALGRVQFWASISLLGGSFSWALGSVLAKKWKSPDVDPFSATAWQMIAAGVANFLAVRSGRSITGSLDHARRERHALPGRLRIMGGIHRIHLAAESRAHFESLHVRVCQPGCSRVSGLAGSA